MQKAVRLVVVLLLVCAGARAQADDAKAEARKLVGQAETEYKLGRFQQALDLYSRAYEAYKAPGLFFNIAQCHYRLRNWERAVFFYESYLRDKPDAGNRALVEELIAESRRELEKEESARRSEEERKRMAEQRRLEEERRAAAEAEARLVAEQRAAGGGEPPTPVYKKWWFWTGLVVVAAAAAGGTLYYLSGETTVVPEEGSLGAIDVRAR